MKRIAYAFATTANIFVLCAMVAVGAFAVAEVRAEQRAIEAAMVIADQRAEQQAAIEAMVIAERASQITDEDRYCLQQNIYFESRNQSTLGQRAVAWVTLNRMDAEQFPDTVCSVVWQSQQFSWTHDGKPDRPGSNTVEQHAWNRAGAIANLVINRWARGAESPVGDALYFHSTDVRPRWRNHFTRVAQVDEHIFYEQ